MKSKRTGTKPAERPRYTLELPGVLPDALRLETGDRLEITLAPDHTLELRVQRTLENGDVEAVRPRTAEMQGAIDAVRNAWRQIRIADGNALDSVAEVLRGAAIRLKEADRRPTMSLADARELIALAQQCLWEAGGKVWVEARQEERRRTRRVNAAQTRQKKQESRQ